MIKSLLKVAAAAAAIAMAAAPTAHAQFPASDEPQPDIPAPKGTNSALNIKADFMEADMLNRQAVFRGNVVVRDTGFTMSAQEMRVFFKNSEDGVERIHSKGNVKIVQPDMTATSGECDYFVGEERIELKGTPKPVVTQKRDGGNSTMSGTQITFWRGKNKIEVQGGIEWKGPGGGLGGGLNIDVGGDKDKDKSKDKDKGN